MFGKFRAYGQNVATMDTSENKRVTYNNLLKDVRTIAEKFRKMGVESQEVLACVMRPSSEFIAPYLASVLLGLDFLPLNPDLPPKKLKEILSKFPVKLLIHSGAMNISKNKIDCEVVQIGSLTDGVANPSTLTDRSSDHRLLIRTSGTSGDPRMVELSWSNLLASAEASTSRLGSNENDLWLSPLPVHHVGGIAPIIRSFINGTAVLPIDYNDREVYELLVNEGITAISLVPRMLNELLNLGLSDDSVDLRFILLGGAAASEDLVHHAIERNLPVRTTYGMTETASQVATTTTDDLKTYPESVGKPLSNVTVTIRDEEDRPLPARETGEIVVEGPVVAEGYRDDSSEENGNFNGDTFYTGDLGHKDQTGRLWVDGRKNRLIITGGEVVNPSEIEETIVQLDVIDAVHVTGIESSEWGEKIIAFVILSSVKEYSKSKLKEQLGKNLPPYKIPKDIIEIDDLPRTDTGTVDDQQLNKIYHNRMPS
jgi:O-succinylbenzoic acid--CoA ligase